MAKKLWGGRFGKKTDPMVEGFTQSIHYDFKLATYDLIGSMRHVEILKRSGYLTAKEAAILIKGLKSIYDKFKNKSVHLGMGGIEDIHTYIQNKLQKKVGNVALKLQMARSRNDQVVFATKLLCKETISMNLLIEIKNLITILSLLAKKYKSVIMPGFTHLQHAQPVYLSGYLGAYAEMLKRDIARLEFISDNIKPSMGAGALAGTPIEYSKYKGSVELTVNSLDTVSDRDFIIDIISALSILATHLSRLAEDLIIWSTKEFDFVEIDEAFCTGSSLMPQKKNPDVLELIRGYAGRLYGNLLSVLTIMKGLPLTYNRDMQLDKEPLFNSFEIVSSELNVLAGLMKTIKFNEEKIKEHLKDESLYATDLVYYLVDKKIPFKEAHTIIGKLIKHSLDNEIQIKDMPENLLRKFSNKIVKKEIIKLFDPFVSVRSKRSIKR
jgi:argininosuccinate lyase